MSIGDTLTALAGEYVGSGAITAEVKTNLGPAFTIYSGDAGPSLADALGIKMALVVRRDGKPIASYGDPPATDPVLVLAYALALALAGALLVVVIRKL